MKVEMYNKFCKYISKLVFTLIIITTFFHSYYDLIVIYVTSNFSMQVEFTSSVD